MSTVNSHSDELEKRRKLLSDLHGTLKVIEEERDLQTPNVVGKLEAVHFASIQVQAFTDKLKIELAKPKFQQVVRQVFQGDKDGRDWNTALADLDRAKADLFFMVMLASVSSAVYRHGLSASRRAVAAAIRTEMVVQHQYATNHPHGKFISIPNRI